jgi:hypothetical protein
VNGREEDKQSVGVRIVGFCAALAALAALILTVPHSSLLLSVIYYVGIVAGTVVVIFTFIWLVEPWPLARLIALLASFAAAAGLGWLAGSTISSPHSTGSKVYARRLSSSFTRLAHRRERAYREMEKTGKYQPQARQLQFLGRAFANRSSSLKKVRASPALGALPSRLDSGLDSISRSYFQLATVITAPHTTKHELRRVRHGLAASETRLQGREARLGDHGYSLEYHSASKGNQ